MRKGWFSVFDGIRCEKEWKDAVLQEIERLPQKRRKRRLQIAVGGIAALCFASTAVIAHRDRVQEWLQEQFFDEQQPAEVTSRPSFEETSAVRVQEIEECFWLEDGFYVKMSEEQIAHAEYLDVYKDGKKAASSLKKQKKEMLFSFGDRKLNGAIWYVQVGEEYYPLPLLGEDEHLVSVEKLPGSRQLVCAVYGDETEINSYLVDLQSGEASSIGDIALEGALEEGCERRYYAIDPQIAPSGSKILYRTNYKNGGWYGEKGEGAWMLYDVAAKKRSPLPKELTKNALLGNEIAFADDRHLIAVSDDAAKDAYYPLVYDCESKELEAFKEYSCNVPFTSSYIYRRTEEGIELYHITDKKTKTLQLSDPEEAVVEIYDAYCFLKDYDGTIAKVYLLQQDRWISFDQLPALYGSMITSAAVLDEDTLLLSADSREGNKEYIVSFS